MERYPYLLKGAILGFVIMLYILIFGDVPNTFTFIIMVIMVYKGGMILKFILLIIGIEKSRK